MSETDFTRYQNVLLFAKKWRKYKIETGILNQESFRKAMQADQYVLISCLDTARNKQVLIYLFDKNSKYTNFSQEMKKLLKKIKDPCTVLLITYKELSAYHSRTINQEKHLQVEVYNHAIFALETPMAPGVDEHRIMSREEVIQLTNNDLCSYVINLPKILDSDPQCIWIGAEVGDVIEIKMLSDIIGETYQYRVVVPKNKKVIVYKEQTQPEVPADVELDEEDADAEYRKEEQLSESESETEQDKDQDQDD